jgi:hypothetical protein
MSCIKELIKDEHLLPSFVFYPVVKYVSMDGKFSSEKKMWDDLECGQDWWDIQVASKQSNSHIPVC